MQENHLGAPHTYFNAAEFAFDCSKPITHGNNNVLDKEELSLYIKSGCRQSLRILGQPPLKA
jgi:hypothetical protein